MPQDLRFSDINTSFDLQQNPLRSYELACNEILKGVRLGSATYLLLLDYPSDINVYISLNSNRQQAIKLDNRNTGFRIKEVFSEYGVKSIAQDVYIWTDKITKLTESDGSAKKIRIVTSGIPGIEVLNNSSINSIASIGEIGKINSINGYPTSANILTYNNEAQNIEIAKTDINPITNYMLVGRIIVQVGNLLINPSYEECYINIRLRNITDISKAIQIANFQYVREPKTIGGYTDQTLQVKGSDIIEIMGNDDKAIIETEIITNNDEGVIFTAQIGYYAI